MTQPGSPPNDSPSSDDRDASSHSADRSSASDDSTSARAGDDPYRRMRDDFDGLDLEHQATFLVDATVSLLAKGIESAARTLADEVDGFVERQRKKAAEKKGASDVSKRPNAPNDADGDDASAEDSADEGSKGAQSSPPAGDDPGASPDASTNAPPSAGDDEEDNQDDGAGDLPPRGPLG